ncbi:amino acid adenylation domain-containing protein [Oscillatoria sp. CS-180]|uniref:amino acid adenylation domain-containing protein n=1 Tax=Oscillatoria sp. CS-180 TaxID=3021720 RepID=UPI00232E0915|nr:amino acid adenylation domain-containing protein [Oscillatoria sp. CS-180]MDB9524396.1 amino acid adenylation domain-containing protein [Oscillatoria sp. CS-180]
MTITANRPAIEDLYPLSPTQQGLLFHSLYGPDSGVYVVQLGFTIRGEFNLEVFSRTWQWLVQRHPVLRTAFTWESLEEPLQVVGQKATLPIDHQDWRAKSPEAQDQELVAWLERDRRQGFDLSAAPLMRLAVLHLATDTYRIVWTYHHLLLDGWSVPLLLRELLMGYQAFEQGQTPILETPRPYRNYIAWLKQQDAAVATQFWQQRLQGLRTPTPLGIDRTRQTANAKPQYAIKQHALSPELTAQLRSQAQTHRLTLHTLVQGAWSIVLGRYSGTSEVLFGSTCAGRPPALQGAENMVGLFINTLPMRVNLAPDQCVNTWLQQLQNQQLEQQPYEYTPLVQIHGSSDIPRSLPLFESIVVFENYPVEPALKQGVRNFAIEDVITAEQTNYPLTLFAAAQQTLDFKVQYDCSRFTSASIERSLGHLETVLKALIEPDQTIGTLPLLTEQEHQQFAAWNQTEQPIPDCCVHEQIAEQAQATPDATAVIFEDVVLTYRDLEQQANQLAHYLMAKGVQPGERVALGLERSAELVITLLAILKVGATYLPLDPAYPAERLRFILNDADVAMLVTANDGMVGSAHPTMPTTLVLDLAQDAAAIAATFPTPLPPAASNTLAYLIYTSGSTGTPKGVPIRHYSLTNLLWSMAHAPGMTADDTLLAVTTPAFDIAALELFLPLITGGTLVIANHHTTRDPQLLAAQLETHDVTLMQATPATWRLLLESGWSGKANLKLLCGGEALDLTLAQHLLPCGQELWNLYGPTETTIWSAALKLEADTLQDGIVPLGPPIANTQFHVLNAQLRPVPLGVPGELYISGLGLTPGYRNRPQLTAQRFISSPLAGKTEDGTNNEQPTTPHPRPLTPIPYPLLYQTGDRVRRRDDGTLEYLGRLDHQVKLRGFRIELGEIEASLTQHPDISQSIVILRNDNGQEPQLIAYVVKSEVRSQESEDVTNQERITNNQERITNNQEPTTIPALKTHLSNHLPPYMVPTQFVVLDALPLTPNGKVDRNALPTPEGSLQPEPLVLPRTQVETAIAAIWQTVLAVEQVGLHDNFFDLGGHSLLMVRVHGQIQQQLSVNIPLVELFRYPTVNALATYLRDRTAETSMVDRTSELAAGKQRLQQRRRRRQRQPAGGQQHG